MYFLVFMGCSNASGVQWCW